MTLGTRHFGPVPAALGTTAGQRGRAEDRAALRMTHGGNTAVMTVRCPITVTLGICRTSPVSGAVLLASPGLTCCAISRPGRREGGDKPMILASAER